MFGLVLLDPLAILVLWWRPRAGVRLVLALMVADLAVNIGTLGITAPMLLQMTYALLALLALPVVRAAP